MRILVALVLTACAWSAPLEDGFRHPPQEARLRCYWWWLNSHVTKTESVAFESLRSWTENRNPGIKYFSGTAAYVKEIDIPAGSGRLELDLGDVREIAEVLVNGKNLGLRLTQT